jgi:hypothetical protein
VLERSNHLKRRKEIYNNRDDVVKHGGDRKSSQAKSNRNNSNLINKPEPAFYSDSAALTGVSESTIHQELKIATISEEVQDAIRNTPLADNKTDLLE